MRLNVRLNENRDRDIIDYLLNCKDVSRGARYIMNRGLKVESQISAVSKVSLDEIIIEKPTMIESTSEDVLDNIMNTVDFFNT